MWRNWIVGPLLFRVKRIDLDELMFSERHGWGGITIIYHGKAYIIRRRRR